MYKPVDYKIFFTIFTLVIFWMIMVSSVSIYPSYSLTEKMVQAWKIGEAYNYFYVLKNIQSVIFSFIVLWIVVKIRYQIFEKYSKYIFAFSLFLLVVVLFMPAIKWATWWLQIPYLPSIQPAEILKVSLILYLSYFFKKYKSWLENFQNWFIPFIMIIWVSFFLLALQPDFWTIMVLLPVSMIMFFLAWWNMKHIGILFLGWIILFLSVYGLWKHTIKPEYMDSATYKEKCNNNELSWCPNKLSYITDRIDNFLTDSKVAIKNSEKDENKDNQKFYQTKQWLIAIWSWWFGWLWFGKSIQKFGFLPEVQGDFIFAVITEELWFVWAFILCLIFMYIWYRGFYISSRVSDPFAKNVTIWISGWILIQAFINIWVNLNILPLTWITLPFISYGWSSLMTIMFSTWILLNISRDIEDKPKFERLEKKKSIFGF